MDDEAGVTTRELQRPGAEPAAPPDPAELLEENRALEEALRLSRRRLSAMRDVARALAGSLDLDALLSTIVAKASELTDAERASIFLVDRGQDELWSRVAQGLGSEAQPEGAKGVIRLSLGRGAAGFVAETGVTLNLPDAYADPRFDPEIDATTGYRTRSLLCTPIVGANGRVTGVMQALNKKGGAFTVEDERLLEAISHQVSVALTNSLLFERLKQKAASLEAARGELTRRVSELDVLSQIERAMSETESAEELLEVVARLVSPLLGVEPSSLEVLDPSSGAVQFCAPPGEAREEFLELLTARVSSALASVRRRERGKRDEQLSTIGSMLSGIVHDFKTPMTVITGYVQLMAEAEDAEERRAHADIILQQTDVMTAMSRELLQFARGETRILIRKVYLQAFARDVRQMLAQVFRGTDIVVEVNVEYRGAARFDEVKMKRALANLAKNAREAMGQRGQFTLTIQQAGDQVELAASDTGPGLPPEIERRLFQSFATHGKEDGTGLGLALVKKLVDDHQGEVRVESRPGAGVTFRLRLPL